MKRSVSPVPAEVPRHLDDLVLVDAALDDAVHLDGEPGAARGRDPAEDGLHREVRVVHRAERLVVQRVEADRDPPEPGRDQIFGLLREQRAVRREGDLDRQLGEHRDQGLHVAAHERLAAGDPQLGDAEPHRRGGDTLDLAEGEQLLAFEIDVLAPEDLLRHAVDAAEVAAVGDRDPEIAYRPSEPVESRHIAEPSDGARRGSP